MIKYRSGNGSCLFGSGRIGGSGPFRDCMMEKAGALGVILRMTVIIIFFLAVIFGVITAIVIMNQSAGKCKPYLFRGNRPIMEINGLRQEEPSKK